MTFLIGIYIWRPPAFGGNGVQMIGEIQSQISKVGDRIHRTRKFCNLKSEVLFHIDSFFLYLGSKEKSKYSFFRIIYIEDISGNTDRLSFVKAAGFPGLFPNLIPVEKSSVRQRMLENQQRVSSTKPRCLVGDVVYGMLTNFICFVEPGCPYIYIFNGKGKVAYSGSIIKGYEFD